MKPNFDIELLPEAVEFLENLDEKSREKNLLHYQKSTICKRQRIIQKVKRIYLGI